MNRREQLAYAQAQARLSNTKHGQATRGSISRTYRTWKSMKARCSNPRAPGFDQYGARGITFDSRWNDFEAFLSDMGERPQGKTLDRWPNGDGNYEPGNCRWATPTEQSRNRRSNRRIRVYGEELLLVEAAQKYGIPYRLLRDRIMESKWPPELAVSAPVARLRRKPSECAMS
jgi:hypothetical protein